MAGNQPVGPSTATESVEDTQPSHRLSLIISSTRSSARSKVKTAKKPVKPRGAGKLKEFMDLPLDIIFETVTFLEPQDLLNLSRVTKSFRSVFLSRTARTIWCRVLSAYPGIPECPEDMVEPQYASFLFEKFCMGCGAARSSYSSYSLRLRLCNPCEKLNIVTGRALKKKHKLVECAVFPLVPSNSGLFSPTNTPVEEYSTYHNRDSAGYFKPEFERVTGVYQQLLKVACAKDIDEFREKQRLAASKMMIHGKDLGAWHRTMMLQDKQDAKEAGSRRYNTICKKMEEMGWETRYYPMPRDYEFFSRWSAYLHQSKEFNERGWKMIRPKLEQLYEGTKERRLQETHERNVKERYGIFFRDLRPEDKEAMPTWPDAKSFSCIQSLLKDRKSYEDTDEYWAALTPTILSEAEPFKLRVRRHLATIMGVHDYYGTIPLSATEREIFQRASCLFTCKRYGCRKFDRCGVHAYPDVLEHMYTTSMTELYSTVERESQIVSTAKQLLMVLGLKPDALREEIGFEKNLICRCGHYHCDRLLSFEELVCHIVSEKKSFEILDNELRDEFIDEEIIIDNHHNCFLNELVEKVDPGDASIQLPEIRKYDGVIDITGRYCVLCYKATHRFNHLSAVEVPYHMKARHGKDYEDGDLADADDLRTSYGGPRRQVWDDDDDWLW